MLNAPNPLNKPGSTTNYVVALTLFALYLVGCGVVAARVEPKDLVASLTTFTTLCGVILAVIKSFTTEAVVQNVQHTVNSKTDALEAKITALNLQVAENRQGPVDTRQAATAQQQLERGQRLDERDATSEVARAEAAKIIPPMPGDDPDSPEKNYGGT
jgi:TolA-binding protein